MNNMLTTHILECEFARVIGEALDLDEPPRVAARMAMRVLTDSAMLRVQCGDAGLIREIPADDLRRSLDDFAARWVIPMVSEMYGRPILDERGRIVVNAVHDMSEAA